MTAEPAGLPVDTVHSSLTLSAVGEVQPDLAVSPTARIEAALQAIEAAQRVGDDQTAHLLVDRLIDYVWFSDPEAVA